MNTEPRSPGASGKFIRAVGLLGLIAIALNGVIGSGIFVLPATVAAVLGPASPIAYLIASALTALIVLCFAEAGSMFEKTGGPYLYAREAFGHFFGFEVGWLFLLTRLTGSAAITAAFTNYLGYFWPSLSSGPGRIAAVTVSIGALTWINLLGVTYGSWTVNFLTIAKLLPLLAFIGAGLFYLDPRALSVQLPEETRSLREAALLLIFAYGGFENASIPSEEVRSPTRNLPVALLVSVTVTTVIYILIQIVAQGHLPDLAVDRTPLASAAQSFLGAAGGALITCGAIVSTLGSNSAVALVGPRILYALAEDKQLPAPLARVHPRFHTPYVSITVFAIVVWAIALYGRFAELVAVSATARLLFSAATCIAVPVLRRKLPHAERRFRLKGGLLIPGLAALVSLWLLSGVNKIQAIMGAIAILAGILVFAINRMFQRESSGTTADGR